MICKVCGSTTEEYPSIQTAVYKSKLYAYFRKVSYCSPCKNKWRYLNTDKAKAQSRLANQRKHEIIEQAKNRPCADCKQSYPPYVMDFDHLGNKQYIIGQDYTRISKTALLDEIQKCDVVCSNCHRARTFNRRIPNWTNS